MEKRIEGYRCYFRIIAPDGYSYQTKEFDIFGDEKSALEFALTIINEGKTFHVPLKDGSRLVMGRDMLTKCLFTIFTIHDVEGGQHV